ncbi:MAG TPA: gamma-glutamyltransferase family protein, partial [Thermomicrobiales bacterium]|nr:gamma-glutamyltransferase family protein [Thermomicrobiales bacterium]
ATPHYLATSAGLQVLEEGGAAMDAVITANAVLTVVYPDQTAIGGDCFFMVWDAATGETIGYNGSGPASRHADPQLLLDQGWTAMPPKGPYAVTVPGTIDAWFAGHERFGRLEMGRLLAPAIALARDGFPVSPRLAGAIGRQTELIYQWPGLQALMMPSGEVPAAGSTIRFPQLATSFEFILREGRDGFYSGEIGTAIATTIRELGGWLDAEDLAAHRGEWVEPIATTYRDVTVKTLPPNTQGLVTLLALRMAEREELGGTWGSLSHLHPLVEAARRGYQVRDEVITDPRFVDIDVDHWLADVTIDDLWADYDPASASGGASHNAGDTVYLCAVDADGNAVSQIQSLFGAFGSAVVAGNTGILLQNRGSSFSLNAERVNVLAPGKRTMHTLMPSMLFTGDELRGPIGTQGGDAQALIQLQLITNLIDFGMEPQAAIEAPRWLFPAAGENGLLMEEGFPAGTVQQMAGLGHQPTVIDGWNPGAGHAQMILRDAVSGVLMGAADPRADGSAAGY